MLRAAPSSVSLMLSQAVNVINEKHEEALIAQRTRGA